MMDLWPTILQNIFLQFLQTKLEGIVFDFKLVDSEKNAEHVAAAEMRWNPSVSMFSAQSWTQVSGKCF
jgi:hypothetical protein